MIVKKERENIVDKVVTVLCVEAKLLCFSACVCTCDCLQSLSLKERKCASIFMLG